MKDLEKLREQIDVIDDKIVDLLKMRADLVLEVKKTKQRENINVYSPARERQIIDRILNKASDGNFPLNQLERIFSNIISVSRSIIGDLQVAYLGPEDSFSQDAALKQFGEAVNFIAEPTVEDVFLSVEKGKSQHGILPASLNVADRLFRSTANIIAELELKEKLVLATQAESLSAVKKVLGNSNLFILAESWLKANLPGVSLVIESNPKKFLDLLKADHSIAVLASEASAVRLEVPVLVRGVGDVAVKHVVLGTTIPAFTGKDKTSLAFVVKDRPGILSEILEPLSMKKITLLNIESKPWNADASEYFFYLELQGHSTSPEVKETLDQLSRFCKAFKVLGSYPSVGAV